MERTCVIIKPDGVSRGLVPQILQRLLDRDLQIDEMRQEQWSMRKVEAHYQEHREQPFWNRLSSFMLSGPVVVLAISGERAIGVVLKMLGGTDPALASPGTLRGDFGLGPLPENVVHASNSEAAAERELGLHFPTGPLGPPPARLIPDSELPEDPQLVAIEELAIEYMGRVYAAGLCLSAIRSDADTRVRLTMLRSLANTSQSGVPTWTSEFLTKLCDLLGTNQPQPAAEPSTVPPDSLSPAVVAILGDLTCKGTNWAQTGNGNRQLGRIVAFKAGAAQDPRHLLSSLSSELAVWSKTATAAEMQFLEDVRTLLRQLKDALAGA